MLYVQSGPSLNWLRLDDLVLLIYAFEIMEFHNHRFIVLQEERNCFLSLGLARLAATGFLA